MIIYEETLDQLAREYHNGYTRSGIPYFNIMTFEEFVEKQKADRGERSA